MRSARRILMAYRETVLLALYNLAASATGFQTKSRQYALPSKAIELPAIYVFPVSETFLPHGSETGSFRTARGLPPKREMDAQIWIYTDGGIANPAPDTEISNALDAIETALQPSVMAGVQTLGLDNVVSHCWIEGKILRPPIPLGGIGIAAIPIKILLR
jgi:hypothetical protein